MVLRFHRDLFCRSTNRRLRVDITVWSYVDQLNISVIADDRTLGDTHEATDAMVHAFQEIRTAAGFSDDLDRVDTAMPPATVRTS